MLNNTQNQEMQVGSYPDQNQSLPNIDQGHQQTVGEALPPVEAMLPGFASVQQIEMQQFTNQQQIPTIQLAEIQTQQLGVPQQEIIGSYNANEVVPTSFNQNQNCQNLNSEFDEQNQEQPKQQEDEEDYEDCPNHPYYVNANVYQIAMLNKMLPKGFKFDILDVIKRQTEIHMKKTAGLVNYNNKKPEIQNEMKQKKLIQKYNQKRLREQQKLQEQQAKIMSEQRKIQAENGSSLFVNKLSAGAGQNKKINEKDNGNIPSNLNAKKNEMFKNKGDYQCMQSSHQQMGDLGPQTTRNKKMNNKQIDEDNINNQNPENNTLNNKKNKGPSAKDYFNTDMNNGMMQSEYSEYKGKLATKGSYEQYSKIIESIVMHKVLLEQQEVPLFLRNPDPEITKNYKGIMNDFGSSGFLNFNTILQRLKNKKYGPGKQNVKHELLQADVRKIFHVCEKYYNYDPISIRVSRTLESFFENEIKKIERGDGSKLDVNNQSQKALDKKQGKGVRQNFKSEVQSERERYENSSFSYKRIKKDKKKDKKKNKKKNKDRRHDRDSDDGKDQTSIGNVNAVDLNEEIEKGDAYGSNSGNLVQKQRLYNNIMEYLTVAQKKGIIPIVQEQLSKEDPVSYQAMIKSNQKFEFDLFSLPDNTCQRLEQYVNECIQQNQTGFQLQLSDNQENEGQIQNNTGQANQNKTTESEALRQGRPTSFNQGISQQHQDTEQNGQNQFQANQQEMQYMQQNEQAQHDMVSGNHQGFQDTMIFYNLADESEPYKGDKHILIEKIGRLDNNQLKGIVPIVQLYQMNGQEQNQDDSKLEFDLYDLPNQKLKELHNYVETCINDANNGVCHDGTLTQTNMDQMKQYMETQQMVDSNGMLQNQLDIQNQMQQQIYNDQQQNFFINQQQQQNGQITNNGQEEVAGQPMHQEQQQQNIMQQTEQNQQTNAQQQQFSYKNNHNVNNMTQNETNKQAETLKNKEQPLEMDQRINLVQSIKQLDMEELTMLGMLMGSKEYRELENDGVNNEGESLKHDDQNGTLIELNVNELSIIKIQYLQKFVDNQRQNQQLKTQNQPQEEGLNTELYNQQKQKADEDEEAQEQQFQEISQWCQSQIDEQMKAFNENQVILQDLVNQQNQPDTQLSEENQIKLYNAVQLDQTIQSNLSQIQQYFFDLQTQYDEKKQQAQVKAQERELLHQVYLKSLYQQQKKNQPFKGPNSQEKKIEGQKTMMNQQLVDGGHQPLMNATPNENVEQSKYPNPNQSGQQPVQQEAEPQPPAQEIKPSNGESQQILEPSKSADQVVDEQYKSQDFTKMSVEALQISQKQVAEEYNQLTYQMNQNQSGIEQIVQVTQQLQQMYQQHQQMVKDAKLKGVQIDPSQNEQMNQIPDQINMQQQQIMVIMQNQSELQNQVSLLKQQNDQINMALQMKMDDGNKPSTNVQAETVPNQNKMQGGQQYENQQHGQVNQQYMPNGMTQEQLNSYYMQMQQQQQMENAHENGQQQMMEPEKAHGGNTEMVLENMQQEIEGDGNQQQAHQMTPYNTQMDFYKGGDAN